MSIRSSVFIDKFSVTVPIPRADWDTATENLHHVSHRGRNLAPVRNEQVYKNYQYAWHALIEGTHGKPEKCFIQAWPKFVSSGYLRLEWTPSKAAPNVIREILALMEKCIPRFRECWSLARISRADITFDVYRLNINQVFAFTKSARTGSDIFKQNNGHINGYRLGAGKSNRRLTIYDKLFHLTKGEPVITYREGLGLVRRHSASRTRFEFRFKDLGSIANLTSFENSFSRYSIASVKRATECSNSGDWQRFIFNCNKFGAQEALFKLVDRKRRQRYREILNRECTPDWFDRDQLWIDAITMIASTLHTEVI